MPPMSNNCGFVHERYCNCQFYSKRVVVGKVTILAQVVKEARVKTERNDVCFLVSPPNSSCGPHFFFPMPITTIRQIVGHKDLSIVNFANI
jgi:hypothetical protein